MEHNSEVRGSNPTDMTAKDFSLKTSDKVIFFKGGLRSVELYAKPCAPTLTGKALTHVMQANRS